MDNKEEIKRPSQFDTEDDLLALQEEFMKSNGPSHRAAQVLRQSVPKVISARSSKDNSTDKKDLIKENADIQEKKTTKKPSLFASRMAQMKQEQQQNPNAVVADVSIMKDVVERVDLFPVSAPSKDKPYINSDSGFPQVFHRSDPAARPMVESLLSRPKQSTDSQNTRSVPNQSISFDCNIQDQFLNDVHRENVEKIQSMDSDTIATYVNDIEERLDPSVIAFLRKRAEKKYGAVPKASSADVSSSNEHSAVQEPAIGNVTQATTANENPVQPTHPEKETSEDQSMPTWIPPEHFEADKLEWIYGNKRASSQSKEDGHTADAFAFNKVKAIRFDLNGHEITIPDQVTFNPALHHHGENADQPGYNLVELLRLGQSTAQSQRIMALQTLSKVIMSIKRRQHVNPKNLALLEYYLRALNVMLYFRSAIDSKHETERLVGLEGIHSLISCANDVYDEEELLDDLLLTKYGLRSVALSTS